MPSNQLIPRMARATVLEALAEARAVAVLGARQVGKSTLVQDIAASDHPAQYLTLDDQATRDAAREDPTGFVAGITGPAVIDEIQRAPDLLLAVKARLDVNQSRGQFLLTGSANLLTVPAVADALPGRVDYVSLWPLAQAEIARADASQLVDRLFDGPMPQLADAPVGSGAFAERLVVGGMPEAQERSVRGRAGFFRSYVTSTLDRTLEDVASVRDRTNLDRLMRLAASRTGGIASYHGMGRDLGLDGNTIRAHTAILESLYLLRRIPAWRRNLGSRIVKSEKIYVVDSGLLGHLLGANEERVRTDGAIAGPMLESFVAMELLRLADLAPQPILLSHYRDKQQREVDVVLERASGDVVGVEVKASASPAPRDFAGLRYLRDNLRGRFRRGIVLHAGSQTLPFGDRLAAVPVSALWQ
jgi:predicted AAA+ superfamily ATPase